MGGGKKERVHRVCGLSAAALRKGFLRRDWRCRQNHLTAGGNMPGGALWRRHWRDRLGNCQRARLGTSGPRVEDATLHSTTAAPAHPRWLGCYKESVRNRSKFAGQKCRSALIPLGHHAMNRGAEKPLLLLPRAPYSGPLSHSRAAASAARSGAGARNRLSKSWPPDRRPY